MTKETKNYSLTTTTIDKIETNATRLGHGNSSEVVRVAVSLLDIVLTEQEKGNRLGFMDSNGKFTEVIFLM